jgi:spore maturation protein CgeB
LRIAIFCHSVLSDWNHGNAHFLRGIASELISRSHEVCFFEDAHAWSIRNLLENRGEKPLAEVRAFYPGLQVLRYNREAFDIDEALTGADLVIVHEWSPPDLIRIIGAHRSRSRNYILLFHDTHHRSITDPAFLSGDLLRCYDGVLAFGEAVRDVYIRRGWAERVWTWHEAADTRIFRPLPARKEGDLVWIGNWGDEERTKELREFLLEPARDLGLSSAAYGVRYPASAQIILRECFFHYRGWLPNYRVPEIMARFRATVHVPRRPYAAALPGIPTIRVFEALACGIPLVSTIWRDVEGLFTPGSDFLVAKNAEGMKRHLRDLQGDSEFADTLASNGLRTIRSRHTCAHRVDELLQILGELTPSIHIFPEKGEDHHAGMVKTCGTP